MNHFLRVIAAGVAILALSTAALAQANEKAQARREANQAAIKALELSRDQLGKMREIRQEKMPEGLKRQDRRAWREARMAKLQAVLSDQQKAKLDSLVEAATDAKAIAGARSLGLTQANPAQP